MRAVHLGVVKLERQLQHCPKKSFMIFTPNEKRAVENTAVHADSSIDFRIYDGGGADDHAFDQVIVRTAFRNLSRQAQIVHIELRKTGAEWYITGADLAVFVLHDSVYRNAVVLPKLASHGQCIKPLDFACRLADAPAKTY